MLADDGIRVVEEVMMRHRQTSVRRVADELGISKTLLHEIISDDLGMKKVCTKWIPKLFISLQRATRVDCYEEFLKNCNQDPTGFFSRIVTKDETRTHHYDLLSQKEAKTWKKPGEKTPIRS